MKLTLSLLFALLITSNAQANGIFFKPGFIVDAQDERLNASTVTLKQSISSTIRDYRKVRPIDGPVDAIQISDTRTQGQYLNLDAVNAITERKRK